LKHLPHSKKAMIEVQFNWIFVLIVGAILVAFFVTLGVKQKYISEEKTSYTSLSSFDSLLTSAGISANTLIVIDTPNVLFEYDCNTFRIGSVSKAVNEKPIFAPKKLKSTKLITWTQDFFLPYKVTNLLYMSNPKKEYVFVGKSTDVVLNNLQNNLPKNFSAIRFDETVWQSSSGGGSSSFTIGSSTQIQQYSSDTQFRFIFSGISSNMITLPESFASKQDGDVTGVSIAADKLYFYEKKGVNLKKIVPTSSSQSYSGEPSFNDPAIEYAALFSDDLENYQCAMGKVARKYSIITRVYDVTFTNVLLSPDLDDVCKPFYDAGITALSMSNVPLTNDAYSTFAASTVMSSAATLKQLNKAMKTESCPLLY